MVAERTTPSTPESEIVTKEFMPDGLYRYVRVGKRYYFEGSGEVEHKDIVRTHSLKFNSQDDDAGFLSLSWYKNQDEMDDLVSKTINAHLEVGVRIDEEEFREQIRENYSRTRIQILKAGSDSLMYIPKEQNRKITEGTLQEIFPGALILIN